MTVAYTLKGDCDCDGTVDLTDLDTLLANYNQTGMTWSQGAFNGNGQVNIEELTELIANYEATVGPSAPQVVLISRLGANPNDANSVQFVVAFSQGVTGVGAADFQLVCSGATGTITSVVGYGDGDGGCQAVYLVTVSDVFGNGTLGLNLDDAGHTIVNGSSPALPLAADTFTGQVYQMASPYVWDGAGSNNHWTTPGNWLGGIAPSPGSTLLFTGPTQTSTYDDFANGTQFQSIEIASSGFSFGGSSTGYLVLSGGLTVDRP